MSTSSERSPVSVSVSVSKREIDPLLKDLNEKKQSFRKNVVSLAVELKEVRSRLASKEQSFSRETLTRQEAETRARTLEEEIHKLHHKLEEKNEEIQASSGYAQEYLKELNDLRSQLAVTQATADASAASAQSAQLQCLALLKELDENNVSVAAHEGHVDRLAEQLDKFQRDLQARESSLKQLQDKIFRIECDIMQAVAEAGASKDSKLRKSMERVSPEDIDKLNKLLFIKDEDIAKLKDEIRMMSSHWKIKTNELESQLEKQRRADQELKKRVLKLEFCLQETRAQTRKLQRLGERKEKALKELKDQLAVKKQREGHVSGDKQNFWETSGFKVVASMSMLILVLFSKR